MATKKQIPQLQQKSKSNANGFETQSNLINSMQFPNSESQLVGNENQQVGQNYRTNLAVDIYKTTNKHKDMIVDEKPKSILPPDLRNSVDNRRMSLSQRLILQFTGALGANSNIDDFDNDILAVNNQKQPKRRNTYFTMSNLMEKGELLEQEKNNDFDEALLSDAGDQKEEFHEYKYGYEVAVIDQEAYYSGNQLLDTIPKDDFELLSFYADSYPFLEERKIIMLIMTSISYLCKLIITQKAFDNFILFVIVWNSIMLAIDDPTSDYKDPVTTIIETFFLWAYGVESALKIVAMGLIFNKGSYLRDSWNILDFIIVITSFISAFSGSSSGSLASLRALRILRPLRTISTIKALKNILNTLFLAMNDMISTMIILSFFFMVFAIGGVQMFSGLLKQRCFRPESGIPYTAPDTESYICGIKACPDGYICGKMIENPNWGVTNFDNISYSFLMVFQCVTLEGWTEVMYWLFDAFSIYIVIYFVLLIFIGSFFLLNLTLAVIKAKFTQSQEGTEDEVEKEYKMELAILKNFRRMQRMFIKKNMLRNMRQDKQWGPIYTKQQTDLNSLRAELEFSWENLIKKAKKKELQAQQKKQQAKIQQKNMEQTQQINEVINKKKQEIRKLVKIFNSKKQVKVMPEQKLIYHFDQDQKLALENNISSPKSTSIANLKGAEQKDDDQLKDNKIEQNFSEQNENKFEQQDGQSSSQQQQQVIKSRKQISFMGISKNESEKNKVPIYPEKDEELNQIFIQESSNKKQDLKKVAPFSILSLSSKKIKVSPKIESSIIQNNQYQSQQTLYHESIIQDEKKNYNSPEKVQDLDLSFDISRSSSTRNVQPSSQNGIKVCQGRSNSISSLRSIGLSDDSDFKDENQKQIDIQTIQEELKKQASAQKQGLQNQQNNNNSDSDSDSQSQSKNNKKIEQKVDILQSKKNVWHINADDDFKLKTKLEIEREIQREKDRIQAEKELQEKLLQNEKSQRHSHSHNSHSGLARKSQNPNRVSQQLELINHHKSEQQMEGQKDPTEKSKKDAKDEHKVTSSSSSSEDDETKDVKQLSAKEKKEQLDQQNVFNWKLKLNDVEFKSETSDDILIHQIEAEQKRQEMEEQSKLATKFYKMKYKLQKKKDAPAINRKKSREELKRESKQKLIDKKNKQMREIKRRITANSIRKSLGLPESRFLRVYTLSLTPISHRCVMRTLINPLFKRKTHTIGTKLSNQGTQLVQIQNNAHQETQLTGKKSKRRKFKNRNYDEDEDHQQIIKFIKEPDYRDARRMMRMKNYLQETKEDDDKEILQQIEDNPDKKSQLMEKLSLTFIYLNIKREDFTTGIKIKTNWSGKEILNNTGTEEHQNKYLRLLTTDNIDIYIFLKGTFGVVKVVHKHFANLINGPIFNNIMTLAVFLNTTLLALDGLFYDQPTLDLLDTLNLTFTYTFIAELSCKLIAMGPVGYLRDKMNIFDGSIVLLSLFELIFLSGSNKAVSAFRAVRIFRTFRVLRVTRLLRTLEFMATIIQVVSKSIDKLMWVALLMFLLIFIYSLLGMQIYGGEFVYEDSDSRSRIRQNFNDFQNAFLVIYQLMSMENWQQVLQLAISSENVNKFLTSIYLISWIFIGNFIFLNLFISILLDGFNVEGTQKEKEDIEDEDVYEEDDGNDLLLGSMDKTNIHNLNNNEQQVNKQIPEESNVKKTYYFERLSTEEEKKIQDEINASKHDVKKPLFNKIECNQSCFLFSKENPFRIVCYRIVVHPQFENMILAFIIISSLKLVVDTYFDDGSEMLDISGNIDYFFNGAFTLEAFMKIVAFGLILDENSYLTETWSQMDFFIVCMSLIDMSFTNVDLPVIKILRLLRILRPLRFISHNINMKIVVIALLESVGAIMNVLIVVVMIMLMFAILGMSLIGQRMGYCDVYPYYQINRADCEGLGFLWKIRDTNFDNILSAMNTLFILSSMEGWPDYMWYAIDSDLAESGPQKNGYMIISYYFVVYIFIGSFFLINLFVGVIFLKFNEAQKSEKGWHPLASDEQKKWIEFQQMIIGVKAEFAANQKPDNYFRHLCWKLATNSIFEVSIMICIVLNIITMGMVYDGSSNEYNNVMEQINLFFTIVFIFECALKLISFGPSGYWTSGWNQFDFFVVASSIIDIIMNQIGSGISFLRVGPQLARVMRVLRVSRLLKLVKSMESLNKTIETLMFSLPSLINVGALLMLVFFIFSVLGVFLFKKVTYGININNYNNFFNFGNAMITLFRCATGEDWPTIMFDYSKTEPECDKNLNNCGTVFAIFYFILFVMFVQFIMLNLFILIIIQNFEDYNMKKGNPLETFNEKLEIFRQQWSDYSEFSNGEKIKQKDIIPFLTNLKDPLGYKTENSRKLQGKELQDFKAGIYRDVMSWNLTDDNEGNIVFNEMLYACMKKAYGCSGSTDADQTLKKLINKSEMETKMKINEAKKKIADQKRQQTFAQEASLQKKDGGNDVNPMVLFLFTSMAFKCMINFKRSDRTIQNLYEDSEIDETFSSSSSSSSSESSSEEKSDAKKVKTKLTKIVEEQPSDNEDNSKEEEDDVNSLHDQPTKINIQQDPSRRPSLLQQITNPERRYSTFQNQVENKNNLRKQSISKQPVINRAQIEQQAIARRQSVQKQQLPKFL